LEIDRLIERLLEVAPLAQIGQGPAHPAAPNPTLVERITTWLAVHPFLNRDAVYVDFLRRYSGVDVIAEYTAENVAKGLDWDLDIPGFATVGSIDCLDDTGGHSRHFDPTVPHISETGFYHFATVCFRHSGLGDEPSDWAYEEFGFDASGKRRWGVYRIVDPADWFCETFSEWLARVIDSRGHIHAPRHFLSDLLAPAKPGGRSKRPILYIVAGSLIALTAGWLWLRGCC
jgi:hypothetical protein